MDESCHVYTILLAEIAIPTASSYLNRNRCKYASECPRLSCRDLPSLTEEHLKQLGVTALGHRVKLTGFSLACRQPLYFAPRPANYQPYPILP